MEPRITSTHVMELCRDGEGHVDFTRMFRTRCLRCGHELGHHLIVLGEPCQEDGCDCQGYETVASEVPEP